MHVVFLGAPGSGKGTQAEKLVKQKNFLSLSSGDLFRKNLREKTDLGLKVKTFLDKGELVPDEITSSMMSDYLKDIEKNKSIVFDGYPRSLTQAESLDKILKDLGRKLSLCLFFEIKDEEIVTRLTGRLMGVKSGKIYHKIFNPPKQEGICDVSGEKLIQREDDKREVIENRLDVFHKQNKPLLDFYEKKGLLKKLDASKKPEDLFKEIENFITT